MTSPPRRVTLVTSLFHPDFSGTGQLLTDLAIGLKAMGCAVSVYTAQPVNGTRDRQPGRELHQGVDIHRVASTNFDKNNRVGRVLNAITYFLSASWALLWERETGPLLIVSHPPFVGLLGWALHRLKGTNYVYLLHDVYPDIAVTLGYVRPDGWTRKIWDWVNRLIVGSAARVVVLGESMKAVVLRNATDHDELEARIRIIHNWVDEAMIRPIPRAENWFARDHGLQDAFVVLYSGNMGLSHDLETVIAAAERMRDRNIVFLFVGEGGKKSRLMDLAEQRGLRNVRFLPYQSREVLPYSAASADVSLVAFEKGIEGLSMPSKLYTILASGRAVVGLVESGYELARIIAAARCGRNVDPTDVDGLVAVLDAYDTNREACAEDGRRGRQYLETHFTRARAFRQYLEVLGEAQGAPAGAPPRVKPQGSGAGGR